MQNSIKFSEGFSGEGTTNLLDSLSECVNVQEYPGDFWKRRKLK